MNQITPKQLFTCSNTALDGIYNNMTVQDYWNSFYSGKAYQDLLIRPSDFAKFSLDFVKKNNVTRLVEFGCGNGRDTNFFLHADLDVFALDASEEAVQKTCAQGTKTNKARCFVHDVSKELPSEVRNSEVRTCFYARFLLHALTDDQITAFFHHCKKASKTHDFLMVEYRTEKDRHRNKVTPKHYRNYLSAEEIVTKAKENEFSTIFVTEGTGLAKWLDDDAYVARQIFYRN